MEPKSRNCNENCPGNIETLPPSDNSWVASYFLHHRGDKEFIQCVEDIPEVKESLHKVINDLKAQLESVLRDNETLKNMCSTCPYKQPLEGISVNPRPTGCICEPDTTRCPYDEAEEDRANRQAARELLNCGQYR